jgi:NADH pyrophosphatase NudC (nudix superfamily)
MAETRTFQAPEIDLSDLANNLGDWYRSQRFEVQMLDVHGGGVLVQASKGGWRNVVGMSSALNVVLRQNGTTLSVEVGAGKWLDKAAVGAVSLAVLWPLAVAAAWGAWKQSQLPKQTYDFIQQFIAMKGASQSLSPVQPSSSPQLAQPGSPVDASASFKFCPACGNSVGETDRFCAKCGHNLT